MLGNFSWFFVICCYIIFNFGEKIIQEYHQWIQIRVMHQSFVSMAPTYWDNRGIAGLRCGAITFDRPHSAGEVQRL